MDDAAHVDSSERHRSRTLVGRFFRNPQTDELILAQAPNPPLWVFLAATAARWLAHPDGTIGTVLTVISVGALSWWAVDEVARGDSLFRRFLGAVVLVGVVAGLVVA